MRKNLFIGLGIAILGLIGVVFGADKVVTLPPGEAMPDRVLVQPAGSPIRSVFVPNGQTVNTAPTPGAVTPAPPSETTVYPLDENGFSNPPLAPGANQIYVANNGNDSNAGTQAAPYATLQKAAYMIRAGKGDRVYARCGDTFYGTVTLNVSGVEGAPCGFFTYGSGPRPHVLTMGSGFLIQKPGVQHFFIQGYWLTAQNRNPADPKFSFTSPLSVGIDVRHNNCADWFVEDCKIEYFDDGVATQADGLDIAPKTIWQSNVTIRRNILVDSWGPGQFDGQGVYIANVNGLTIQGNFFDHNGWNENIPQVAARKEYGHNMYIAWMNSPCHVQGNYSARAAAYGSQQRCGGENDHNVYFQNGLIGLGSESSFNFHDNVALGGQVETAKPPLATPGVGHGGVELAALNNTATNNYFWGYAPATIPGAPATYIPAAFQISRRDWTPAGTISFMLKRNAINAWPSLNGKPNELSVFAPPVVALDRAANPPLSAWPNPAEVWPTASDLANMRSRGRGVWLPQYDAATVVAKFTKAAGR